MYAAVLNGANYAPGDIREESHVMIFDTITEARESMRSAADYHNPWALNLYGWTTLDTPVFGGEGDSYTLYQLPDTYPYRHRIASDSTEHATREELARAGWRVLISEGDPYPDYILEFGPRGGIRSYRP